MDEAYGRRPATPAPQPAPPVAAGIDFARWKLTLPEVDSKGKVREVKPPALAAHVDRYFAPVDGGLRFRVWHGGGTTSGSPNPRSELRELNPDGSLAEWSTRKGGHTLAVDLQVNRLTKVRPHLVLAQIHGGGDDVTVFRLEGTKLWITDGDETNAHLVTDRFELGRRYRLEFAVADGEVEYRVDGQDVPYTLEVDDDSCYFKTGAYLQSNAKTAKGESTDEYAEVVLHAAQVVHS